MKKFNFCVQLNTSYGTLVSCRISGASYLNRVELQNGCLALGHANLFIPSTLGGSCLDGETGKTDQKKLAENMNMAMDVYISRVNGSLSGETSISLFKGSDSTSWQQIRPSLIRYLKGSKKQKENLQTEDPALYSYFEKIWKLRCDHITKGLFGQYLFYLLCSNCKSGDCPHPICCGPTQEIPRWYEGGPPITYLPLPVPDPSRSWGSACSECEGICSGHYLKPLEAFNSTMKPLSEPPSTVLSEAFKKLKGTAPSDDLIEELSKKTLLKAGEVQIWFSHLATVAENRKRGAQKASET